MPRGLERASDSSDPQFKVVSLSLAYIIYNRGLVGLGFDSRARALLDRDSNLLFSSSKESEREQGYLSTRYEMERKESSFTSGNEVEDPGFPI